MARKTTTVTSPQGYNIIVQGRHVQVTDSMKEYAIEKISKVEKFSDRIIDVLVTMDIQKLDHRVDIVIKVNHWTIKSSAVTTQMYASIDQAVHKLEKQLRRYKKKIQNHQARGLNVVDMRVNVMRRPEPDDVELVNEEIEAENRRKEVQEFQPHEVVATETRPLKILTMDEAIAKMELSGDGFLLYRCEEDQKLKVIYRRSDENYGVIEAEA